MQIDPAQQRSADNYKIASSLRQSLPSIDKIFVK